ncbi:MAG: HEAT repeat domain-containing protein [Bacteroidota bacterium]
MEILFADDGSDFSTSIGATATQPLITKRTIAIFFLFVLVTTFFSLFLIAVGSVGLIVSKVRESTVESLRDSRDTNTRSALNSFLFSEILNVDSTEQRALFLERLIPKLIDLKIALDLDDNSPRNVRRRSLKRVMLQLTSEVIGETRVRLTTAFAYFGFVEETIALMKNNRWWIRAKSCKNAGLMLNEAALPHLEQCLDDENDDVRIEAAQAMIDIAGVEIVAPILMRLKEMSLWMRVRLSKSILVFGEHAVPPLITALRSEYPVIQGFCVENLGILGDVKAVPTLLEYINYAVIDVKHKSLIALGKLGDDRSIPIIKKFLSAEDELLRVDAAKAAGNLSTPFLAYSLHWMLMKDTISVKLAAAEALSRTGERGIQSLKYAAGIGDEQVRMVAIQFLHEAGVPAFELREDGGAV